VCYLFGLLPSRSTPPEGPHSDGGDARVWERALREAAPLLGLGTTLAVTVLAGFGAGYWLDERFSTRPVFVLLGSGLGVGAAMYYFFKTVAGATRKPADRKQ
jgi:F0F1-type ATP synthase assembly protein I